MIYMEFVISAVGPAPAQVSFNNPNALWRITRTSGFKDSDSHKCWWGMRGEEKKDMRLAIRWHFRPTHTLWHMYRTTCVVYIHANLMYRGMGGSGEVAVCGWDWQLRNEDISHFYISCSRRRAARWKSGGKDRKWTAYPFFFLKEESGLSGYMRKSRVLTFRRLSLGLIRET